MIRSSWLLRLFPRHWRARYGAEFIAMLDTSPPTPRDVLGIVRLAAGEWILRTVTARLILGLALPALAMLCAVALSQALPIAPRISFGHDRLIAPPSYTDLFGLLFYGVVFAAVARFMARLGGLSTERHAMSSRTFGWWLGALFVSLVLATWWIPRLAIGWRGASPIELWFDQAVQTILALMNLLAADRYVPQSDAVRIVEASRPLGLQ